MLYERIQDDDRRAYCGPTAIAAVTGVPTSKIRRKVLRFRRIRKGDDRIRSVRGLGTVALLKVMQRLGWRVASRAPTAKGVGWGMTLGKWCEDNAHRKGPFIVVAGNHYVAVSEGMLCDTFSGGKPVPWQQSVWSLRTIVQTWWEFTGKTRMPPDPKPPVDHVARRAAKARARMARLTTRAKRIATALKKAQRQVAYYERKQTA